MLSIKELVKNNRVRFKFYRAGELWYEVYSGQDRDDTLPLLEFPVPISDTGDAVFLKEDKAILFMRYISRHLNSIEEGKKDSVVV